MIYPVVVEWQQIRSFPTYSVSDTGFVRNNLTERLMRLNQNQRGIVCVGLFHNGVQYKRSVAVLVAQAFLVPPRYMTFNTPINLDGDRTNNNVENLVWRPSWFARKYHAQFRLPRQDDIPVEDTKTYARFRSTWDAAVAYGLLEADVRASLIGEDEVWPTYSTFRVLE